MIDIPKEYKVIGIMSGTSLDGIDLAYCTFLFKDQRWHYLIHHAQTIPYDKEWKAILSQLPERNNDEIQKVNIDYGMSIGQSTASFIKAHSINPDFIASHGHTVFHDPAQGLTLQVGDGKTIADITGITVINDFRREDLKLGGQGAPLVPIGDRLLFQDYTYCLNLGGFANISFDRSGQRIGFDIGPCNLVLNHLSSLLGKEYDKDGNLAKEGKVIPPLLEELNAIHYYQEAPPKSLGKEWMDAMVFPIFHNSNEDPVDLLRTSTEHIAYQIARVLEDDRMNKVLVTGGGAYNKFLIERVRDLSVQKIIIPDDLTVQFKEALVFAFLSVLRYRKENNILSSVTGASRDHSAGEICKPGG